MSDSKRLFHTRRFLNSESGAAMLEAELFNNSWNDKNNGERHVSVNGVLHLTDCSRSIELDFGFHDLDEAREQIRKLERIIYAAEGMLAAMVRAAQREWPGKKL